MFKLCLLFLLIQLFFEVGDAPCQCSGDAAQGSS
jgi:hypothetical protein